MNTEDTVNTVLYAGNALGPDKISANMNDVYASGFSTILLGLFHIGRGKGAHDPPPGDQQTGAIVFNNPNNEDPGLVVVSRGQLVAPIEWVQQLEELLKEKSGKGEVTKIGCSVGGGEVEDYQTIWRWFVNNGEISPYSALYENFKKLHDELPFIDFIDLDCEETYSDIYPNYAKYEWKTTVIAFGNMLKQIGFNVTICPAGDVNGWMQILNALYKGPSEKKTVSWMNLQCYAGGEVNDPADWVEAIDALGRGIDGASFTVPGLWCCHTDQDYRGWTPDSMRSEFAVWKTRKKKPIALKGRFIWDYQDILANQNSTACDPSYSKSKSSAVYCNALVNGLAGKMPPKEKAQP